MIHVVLLCYVDERDFEYFHLCDEELGHASTAKVFKCSEKERRYKNRENCKSNDIKLF